MPIHLVQPPLVFLAKCYSLVEDKFKGLQQRTPLFSLISLQTQLMTMTNDTICLLNIRLIVGNNLILIHYLLQCPYNLETHKKLSKL